MKLNKVNRGNKSKTVLKYITCLFQGLDELSVKGQNEMGSGSTFWRITKHDIHSIPEGRWLRGQVEVRSEEQESYWARNILISPFRT